MVNDLVAKLTFGDLRTPGKLDEAVTEVQQKPVLVKYLIECPANLSPDARLQVSICLKS